MVLEGDRAVDLDAGTPRADVCMRDEYRILMTQDNIPGTGVVQQQ